MNELVNLIVTKTGIPAATAQAVVTDVTSEKTSVLGRAKPTAFEFNGEMLFGR